MMYEQCYALYYPSPMLEKRRSVIKRAMKQHENGSENRNNIEYQA